MNFCKECLKFVLSTHEDEMRVSLMEWLKFNEAEQKHIKGTAKLDYSYETHILPHRSIEVPDEQRSLFECIAKLNEIKKSNSLW